MGGDAERGQDAVPGEGTLYVGWYICREYKWAGTPREVRMLCPERVNSMLADTYVDSTSGRGRRDRSGCCVRRGYTLCWLIHMKRVKVGGDAERGQDAVPGEGALYVGWYICREYKWAGTPREVRMLCPERVHSMLADTYVDSTSGRGRRERSGCCARRGCTLCWLIHIDSTSGRGRRERSGCCARRGYTLCWLIHM